MAKIRFDTAIAPLPVHDELSPEELEAVRVAFEKETGREVFVRDGVLMWAAEKERLRWWFWPSITIMLGWIGLTAQGVAGGVVIGAGVFLWLALGLSIVLAIVCAVPKKELETAEDGVWRIEASPEEVETFRCELLAASHDEPLFLAPEKPGRDWSWPIIAAGVVWMALSPLLVLSGALVLGELSVLLVVWLALAVAILVALFWSMSPPVEEPEEFITVGNEADAWRSASPCTPSRQDTLTGSG